MGAENEPDLSSQQVPPPTDPSALPPDPGEAAEDATGQSEVGAELEDKAAAESVGDLQSWRAYETLMAEENKQTSRSGSELCESTAICQTSRTSANTASITRPCWKFRILQIIHQNKT